jgi:hypothetical protein
METLEFIGQRIKGRAAQREYLPPPGFSIENKAILRPAEHLVGFGVLNKSVHRCALPESSGYATFLRRLFMCKILMTASGSRSMIIRYARKPPSGLLRPCSHALI